MKDRLLRFAPKVGYPFFYLFVFVVAFFLLFPFDKLKEKLVATFNAQQRGTSSPTELAIESLDSSWFTGVKARGIRLVLPPSASDKTPATLHIDEARARISLVRLLGGVTSIGFTLHAFEGDILGTFEITGKDRAIDLTFDSVDVSKVEPLAASIGFPLGGTLGGSLSLALPGGRASKGNGSLNLEIKDLVAGTGSDLNVKTPLGPFTLPKLRVGTLSVVGDAKDGILKLTKVSAGGADVDVTGEGRVQLRENAPDARLDAVLKFRINDSYRTKNDKTKLLFGAPGSKGKPMLEANAKIAKSKTADGFYALRVGGTLAKPDIQPSVAAAASATPTVTPSTASDTSSD